MLKWCKDLRIGEGVKRADKIRRKLNHGKIVPGVYLITFSENPRNLLEIIPALTMIQQSAAGCGYGCGDHSGSLRCDRRFPDRRILEEQVMPCYISCG